MNVVGWNREEMKEEERRDRKERRGRRGRMIKGKGEERTCGQFEGKSPYDPSP
jgi:hypothetical protein